MLCVYYRLGLPDLLDISQYTDESLEALFTENMCLHYDYLKTVTNLNYRHPIIITSKVRCLIDTWKKESIVSIEGPKGCGKTVLCATLYQMHADEENFDHIFLTWRSLEFYHPECRKYFNDFLSDIRTCLRRS